MNEMQSDHDATGICPPGYLPLLVLAAVLKNILSEQTLSTGERLELLEKLNSLPHDCFTVPMLASIQPAGSTEMALSWETSSLDRGGEGRCDASFGLLTKSFHLFAAANPSIAAAQKNISGASDVPLAMNEAA